MSPCELHVCSYFRTISRFWLYRRVHFGFIVIIISISIIWNLNSIIKCTILNWITRYTFEHSYLLSTTHSSQPCSSCYRLTSSIFPYLSISEKSTRFIQHLCLRHLYQTTTNHPHISVLFQSLFQDPHRTITLRSRSRVLGQELVILVFHQAVHPKINSRIGYWHTNTLYLSPSLFNDMKPAVSFNQPES